MMTASQTNNTAAADIKSIPADSKTTYFMPLPTYLAINRKDKKVRYEFLANIGIESLKLTYPQFFQTFNITETTGWKIEHGKIVIEFTQSQFDQHLGKHFFKLMYLVNCLRLPETVTEEDRLMLNKAMDIDTVTVTEGDFPVKKYDVTIVTSNNDIIARNLTFLLSQFSNDQLNYFALLPAGDYDIKSRNYGMWFFFILHKYVSQIVCQNVLARLTPDTCARLCLLSDLPFLSENLMSEAFLTFFRKIPSSSHLLRLCISPMLNFLHEDYFIFKIIKKDPKFFKIMLEKCIENKEEANLLLLNVFISYHPNELYRTHKSSVIDSESCIFQGYKQERVTYIKDAQATLLYQFLLNLIHWQPIENILAFLELFDNRVMELSQWLNDYISSERLPVAKNRETRFFLRALQDKFEPVLRADSKVVVSAHIREFYNTIIAQLLTHDRENPIVPKRPRVVEQDVRTLLNNYGHCPLVIKIILDYFQEACIALLESGNGLLTFHSNAFTSLPTGSVYSTALISKHLFTPISVIENTDDPDLPLHDKEVRGIGFLYDVRDCQKAEIRFRRLNHDQASDVTTIEYAAAQPYAGNRVMIDDFCDIRGIYIDVLDRNISSAKTLARNVAEEYLEKPPIFFYDCEAKDAYLYTETEQAADEKAEFNAANSQSAAMTVARKK